VGVVDEGSAGDMSPKGMAVLNLIGRVLLLCLRLRRLVVVWVRLGAARTIPEEVDADMTDLGEFDEEDDDVGDGSISDTEVPPPPPRGDTLSLELLGLPSMSL